MADEWPLRNYLELDALPGAVPCARLHTRQVLWEWGLSAFSEDAELIVSELVTNAVQASVSPDTLRPVRMWLSSDRSRLIVHVWDTNHNPPTQAEATGDDEDGRGLCIIESISTKWDWQPHEHWGGKTVWALLELA